MSDQPVKWYEENAGETSGMRVGMMICVLVASALAIAGLFRGSNLIDLAALCAMFLGAGFGGKAWQKGKE